MSTRPRTGESLALIKFPDTADSSPVIRNVFPVSERRELDEKSCGAAVFRFGFGSKGPKIAKFPVKFPVSREFVRRRVRSALPRQPAIRAFGQALQEAREWAGSPGFLRVRFRLRTPGSLILRRKLPKVSGLAGEYSCFAETIGGDWFDPDSRPSLQFKL